MSYVVGSKLKELIKKLGCNTAGDLAEGVSAMVEMEVKKAVARAKSNGRKTLRASDL